jgi:hypothetical protein
MTKEYILENIKILKHIDDTEIYDGELSLLISACISKLATEGIPLPEESDLWVDQYILCIFHYITSIWDEEVSKKTSEMLYVDSVENLRMRILYEKHRM